jgi:hypothetical protein
VRLWINTAFAALVAILYGFSAGVILWNAMNTAGFAPNDAQATVYGLTSGAVVAFMLAQLGLAVGNSEQGTGDSLKAAVSGDAAKGRGDLLLGLVAAVFLFVGFWYLMLWILPDLVAAEDGTTAVTQAPEFIALQAKAFLGILIAGFTAVAAGAGGGGGANPPNFAP